MLEIISNGNKWARTKPWLREPDTIEVLLETLNKYTLDPTFENYGNFINPNPTWSKTELKEKYKGCTKIFGNFMDISHVFNIITDEQKVIDSITKAVNKNKETNKYRQYKENILKQELLKSKARDLFEQGKINQKQMYQISSGYSTQKEIDQYLPCLQEV